nr:DUF423 domain-containing protein [Robiginitalea sp. SC105]
MTAVAFGGSAVALGALGAHGLKEQLEPEALESFRTGVQYQMYHALFLLFLGLEKTLDPRSRKRVFGLVVTGILCFSFSIYFLSTAGLTGWDLSAIGWITPLGGVLLISGWGYLLYRIFRSKGR